MAGYSLTPYRVVVHPTRKPTEILDVGEALPGVSLLDLFAGATGTHQGGQFADDEARARGQSIGFASVLVGKGAVLATADVGRSGQVGALHRRGKKPVPYGPQDEDRKVLRHLLLARPGQRMGVLLVERVGNSGAIGLLSRMLREAARAKGQETGHDVRVKIEGLADAKTVNAAVAKLPVKSITLTAVDRESGRPLRRGPLEGKLQILMTAPARHSWSLPSVGGLDADSIVHTVTAEARRGAEPSAVDAFLATDEEWDVAMAMSRPGGRQSTVHVTAGSAPRMNFDIEQADAGQPTREEFAAGCQGVLEAFALDDGVVSLPSDPWQSGDGWKAVWDRVED